MSDAEYDELDLLQQEATPAAVTSSGRPRRATRETSRYPREISAKTTAGEASGSSSSAKGKAKEKNSKKPESSRTRAVRQRKTKRKVEEDAEDSDGCIEIVRPPYPLAVSSSSPSGGKAKKKGFGVDVTDPDYLLTSPKSVLVGMEISDILNAKTWLSLSEDARRRLEDLLPETAFSSYVAQVEDCHPSRQVDRRHNLSEPSTSKNAVRNANGESSQGPEDAMEDVREARKSRGVLDVSVFTDPHFESAARTFQDHLYTGWYTGPHRELVQKYSENIRSGNQHAPWKDDVWGQNHDTPEDDQENASMDPSTSPKGKGRGIRTNAFEPLIKHKLLAVGDILSYNKNFTIHGVSVEKDCLVYAIQPKTHAVTVVTCAGTARSLPGQLLVPAADISTSPVDIREIQVDSPMQLERALLDVDGRVPRPDHSHNALKCISMWRWPASSAEVYTEPEMMQCILENQLDRGGRELYGTLFYLRGTTNGG